MAEPDNDIEACCDAILERCGRELRLATPLGLGKPNILLNALYTRARKDSGIRLTIYTALSLMLPDPGEGLQARFLKPFLQRQFGEDYPGLDYAHDQRADRLPPNVRVHEFYLQSGAMLDSAQAQRAYISQNYTHVARDLVDQDINLVVQMVARREGGGDTLSLSSNPDVTLDLLDRIEAAGRPRPMLVGVLHPDLAYLGHGAEVPSSRFDVLLESAGAAHRLFALPREPVDDVEYGIGFHASALVRDGGTLQIGIGALSDALVRALLLRQQDNAAYRQALGALDDTGQTRHLADRLGGLEPLQQGLYGASEMVMDGFMHLRRAGLLKREVFDDIGLERALAAGLFRAPLDGARIRQMRDCKALPSVVDAAALERLVHFGLLPEHARLQDGQVRLQAGSLPTRIDDDSACAAWALALEGRRLRHGRYLRGAFYLGSRELYGWLRQLEGEDWEGLDMTRVSDVNQLYGGREELDTLQRRGARFFNTCMMATVLGDVVSDGLADGRIVSGVGGQYNFVAMAHELDDGRSVLMLRAMRDAHGQVQSNIRFNYGHVTIPRHLRDLVITEYGIASLRGKSDEDCIKAMLSISDARFIDTLAAQARDAGKLAPGFAIPEIWRRNTPGHLRAALAPLHRRKLLDTFPFGSDFSDIEQQLLPALDRLRKAGASRSGRLRLLIDVLRPLPGRASHGAALDRMGLRRPQGLGERFWRRLLLQALARTTGKGTAD